MTRIGLGSINQPPSSIMQPIRQDPFLESPHNAMLTAPNMATPILENTSMHGVSFSPEFFSYREETPTPSVYAPSEYGSSEHEFPSHLFPSDSQSEHVTRRMSLEDRRRSTGDDLANSRHYRRLNKQNLFDNEENSRQMRNRRGSTETVIPTFGMDNRRSYM